MMVNRFYVPPDIIPTVCIPAARNRGNTVSYTINTPRSACRASREFGFNCVAQDTGISSKMPARRTCGPAAKKWTSHIIFIRVSWSLVSSRTIVDLIVNGQFRSKCSSLQSARAIFRMATVGCLFPMIAANAGPVGASGAELDPFDVADRYIFFVSEAAVYDNNVFRLPAEQANLASFFSPDASRQDHINVVSVGSDDTFDFSRQLVNLDIQVSKNHFNRNTFLDDASGNGDLNWKWEAGSNFSGDAGIGYSRQLANSAQTLFYGKDLVGSTNEFADVRDELSSRWVLFGGIRAIDSTNSAVQVQINNFHSKSGNVGIEFDSTDTNSLGIEYLYTDARALQYFGEVGLNYRNYDEDTENLTWKYAFDDKSEIDGNAGYLKRYYPGTSLGAFSGDVWRINFNWSPTDKSHVSAAAWRDLEAYYDAESNYFVARGESFTPAWVASEKINFSASFSWVTQDYIASNPSFYALGARQDKVVTQQISMAYVPYTSVSLSVAYNNEHHSSTLALFNYEDRVWTGTIKIIF